MLSQKYYHSYKQQVSLSPAEHETLLAAIANISASDGVSPTKVLQYVGEELRNDDDIRIAIELVEQRPQPA